MTITLLITGAMNVNVRDVVDGTKALIAAGRPVDAAWLGDPALPLVALS